MPGFYKTKFIGLFSLIACIVISSPLLNAAWFARGRLAGISFQDQAGVGQQANINQMLFNKKLTGSVFPGLTFGLGFMSGQSVSQSATGGQNPAVISGLVIPIEYSWPISKVVFLNIGYYLNQLSYRPAPQLAEVQVNPSFLTVTGQSYLTKAFFMELSVGLNTSFVGGSYQGIGFGVLLN